MTGAGSSLRRLILVAAADLTSEPSSVSAPTATGSIGREGSRTAVIAAFAANLVIAVAKFVAAGLTGSAAMLAEGYHSLADTGNQGMLLYGMRAARRPANTAHPFGRGKESYFWSFMVAVMLFAGGAVLAVRHGLAALWGEHRVEHLGPSFVVLAVALAVEGTSLFVARREFGERQGSRSFWRAIRESKDTSLLVVILEDSAAITGLLVALVGTALVALTGRAEFDGIASLVIGVILGGVAVLLASETKELLIGEAAGRADRAAIRARLLAMPEVESVGRLLTMQLGPDDILVNVEVDLDESLSGTDIAAALGRAERRIQEILPAARNVFLEYREPERG